MNKWSEKFKCQNCGFVSAYEDLPDAKDLNQRLQVGCIYTDVECPKCGALCYPVKEENN